MAEDKRLEDELIRAEALLNSVQNQKANDGLGVTSEYTKANRDKLWDSTRGKRDYKDKVFGDKQTYRDPISGEILHKSQNAAQNKYKMKDAEGNNISTKWSKHTAETDHINAISDAHAKVKYNPYLTDNDFKEIINSESNYRILSKKDNTAKGDKNDLEIVFDPNADMTLEGRATMAAQKIGADISLASQLSLRTVKNISAEFAEGANSALMGSRGALTVAAFSELCKIKGGEKTLEDGVKDFVKLSAEVAVVGGGERVILTGAKGLGHTLGCEKAITKIIGSNGAAQAVVLGYLVKDSAVRLVNGEITAEEFIGDVSISATMVGATMVGAEVGATVGAFIGSVVGTILLPGVGTIEGAAIGSFIGEVTTVLLSTVVCSAISSIYTAVQESKAYKRKEAAIRRVADEAINVMKQQRERFIELVEQDNQKWNDTVKEGFQLIFDGISMEITDFGKINNGLNVLLSLVDSSVRFQSVEEYEQQIDSVLELSF